MESPKKKDEVSSSAPAMVRNLAALEAARATPSFGAIDFVVAAKSEALEWDTNLEIMAEGLDERAQAVLKTKSVVLQCRVCEASNAARADEASLQVAIEGWEAAANELSSGLSAVLRYGIGRSRLLDLVATLGVEKRRARAEADSTSSAVIERALELLGTTDIAMREATIAEDLFDIALRALLDSGADVDEGEADIQFGSHSPWASRLEGARVGRAAPVAKRALSAVLEPGPGSGR